MAHVPRKRFGQNFLVDDTVLHNIVQTIDPQADDVMVEIGPGLAAMTRLLLTSLRQLHVVELDRDLVAYLAKKFDPAKLIIHAGDALQFDFAALPRDDNQRIRIVGNLPYNISSPLLFHFAKFTSIVLDQHFMLQKEVVDRMVAAPGSKVYGRLSVMLQWRYQMENMLDVPPTAFDPPPRVNSAIVRMIPIAKPLACDEGKLSMVVAKAFSQRRKVIRNSLAGMFTDNGLIDAGVDPQVRPEELTLAQYVTLANLVDFS